VPTRVQTPSPAAFFLQKKKRGKIIINSHKITKSSRTRKMKTDINLQELIDELKKTAAEKKVNLWKRIATDLEKSTRMRREVNLYKLNKYTKENDIVIVPGKVLGTGEINHKLTVAALSYSESALAKLNSNKSTVYSIADLIKANPQGKKVRILG
jgi:large subunit ribosomal protein L18e